MSPRLAPSPLFAVLAVPLVAVATACNPAMSPRYRPDVTNAANDFQFRVIALDGVSDALTYTWQNDGTAATVNQSTAVTAGSTMLTVTDAVGAVVYPRGLTDNGTYPTTSGVAGTWHIRVVFTKVSGTITFRLQKSP